MFQSLGNLVAKGGETALAAIFEHGATLDDAIRLAYGFQKASVWRDVALDEGAVRAFLQSLADNPDALVIITPHGGVAGLVMPLWFAPQVKLGVELFWYCESPGHGQALRQRFEGWAANAGADTVQFSCMLTEREHALRRMYRRSGFEPIEIGFRKAVA